MPGPDRFLCLAKVKSNDDGRHHSRQQFFNLFISKKEVPGTDGCAISSSAFTFLDLAIELPNLVSKVTVEEVDMFGILSQWQAN